MGSNQQILNGAKATLGMTDLIIIETYFFKLHETAPLFIEMINYMLERGFRVIDMSEPLWREKDNSLWQIDMFFVKTSRPEFLYNSYS